MLFQGGGVVDKPALALQQILKVHRPRLAWRDIGRPYRIHRLAEDAGLDLGAGVEANHGVSVEEHVKQRLIVLDRLADPQGQAFVRRAVGVVRAAAKPSVFEPDRFGTRMRPDHDLG